MPSRRGPPARRSRCPRPMSPIGPSRRGLPIEGGGQTHRPLTSAAACRWRRASNGEQASVIAAGIRDSRRAWRTCAFCVVVGKTTQNPGASIGRWDNSCSDHRYRRLNGRGTPEWMIFGRFLHRHYSSDDWIHLPDGHCECARQHVGAGWTAAALASAQTRACGHGLRTTASIFSALDGSLSGCHGCSSRVDRVVVTAR